jgi:hypothetical protein
MNILKKYQEDYYYYSTKFNRNYVIIYNTHWDYYGIILCVIDEGCYSKH